MRVPADLARPLWADDDHFDLDFHLRRSAILSPGGRPAARGGSGPSRPLDVSKPLHLRVQGSRRTARLLAGYARRRISGMLIARRSST
jgi:hypothetical protein